MYDYNHNSFPILYIITVHQLKNKQKENQQKEGDQQEGKKGEKEVLGTEMKQTGSFAFMNVKMKPTIMYNYNTLINIFLKRRKS